MKKVTLKIEGMSCSACQSTLEKYLNKQDGVEAVVNLVMASASIVYDDSKVGLDDLNRFVKEAGYKSLGLYKDEKTSQTDSLSSFIIYGILLSIMMIVSMFFAYLGEFLLGLAIVFLFFGRDILLSGLKKLFQGHPNMDSLVSIGVLSSFVYSLVQLWISCSDMHLYFESSAMILYFVKLGKYLEHHSQQKARLAIKELVQITPETALIKKGKKEVEVTIDEVQKGDILICKPGMKVGVDGIILKGEAHFEEAFITGESFPKKKAKGDFVLAGSFNMDGYILYQAQRIGSCSTISEMVRRVLEAANSKVKLSRMADKLALYFTPFIFFLAFFSLFIHLLLGHGTFVSLNSFVSVLVISCPCALGLATPMAVVVSVGALASKGILIRNSEVLERISKVDTLIFDKTGTLTYGSLQLSEVNNYSTYNDDILLNYVANLEAFSSHPIAKAFKPFLNHTLNVQDFKNYAGMGILGVIDRKNIAVGNEKLMRYLKIDLKKLYKEGYFYVAIDNQVVACILVSDKLRENSLEVVTRLKSEGFHLWILSGDEETKVKKIANELGIDFFYAGVLPSEKEDIIKKLRREGHVVMMIGDGVNDALSLVESDVSLTLSSGCDIALDCSDALLMQDDLSKIEVIIDYSKRTIAIIKENLAWAFIYNIFMIPQAMGFLHLFYITPMFASFSMAFSSLVVVLNSLRLSKIKK